MKRTYCAMAATAICAALIFSSALPQKARAFQPFVSHAGVPYIWDLSALPSGTLYWRLEPGAPPLLRESMLAITQEWSDATGGVLKFAEGDGGISVLWDASGSEIYDTLFLAYTFFTTNASGRIQMARITVNASAYSWQRGGYGGVGPHVNGKREANLDSVMLHELGHALGLDHSDRNPDAIVGAYSYYDLPTMNSVVYPGAETLHSDDIAGARFIYSVPADAIVEPPFIVSASPQCGRRPLNVSFTQSGGDSSTLWNFGDGATATGADPIHKFTSNGTYTVTAECNGRISSSTIVVENTPRKRRVRSGYSSGLPRR